MKMKCDGCGKTITSNSRFCTYCGAGTKEQRLRRVVIPLVIIAIAISAIVLLWKNYLMPWQIPLYIDRKAILEYADEIHPGYKIAEEHICFGPAAGRYFAIEPDCYITFEENGFQYRVFAEDGEIYADNYARMKLQSEVETFINDRFFEYRGIKDVEIHCSFDTDDGELPSEWSECNDRFFVTMSIYNQGSTPKEVGWLYTFYEFWRENWHYSPEWVFDFDIYSTRRQSGYDCKLHANYISDYGSAAEMYEDVYIPNPPPMPMP